LNVGIGNTFVSAGDRPPDRRQGIGDTFVQWIRAQWALSTAVAAYSRSVGQLPRPEIHPKTDDYASAWTPA